MALAIIYTVSLMYCTSIALQVAGKLEQAVMHDPVRNDLHTATKGRGAFVNEKRMRGATHN